MEERIPTSFQAQDLDNLIDGWELIVGAWHATGKERIYWRKHNPAYGLYPYDTLECCYPKMKRYKLGFMERYGWIVPIATGWEITEEGRKAFERYKAR